jgi:hypothetical protein
MSTQLSEKVNHLHPLTTTQNSSLKTPFGIEDILYLNNNNNSNENLNKLSLDKPVKILSKNSGQEEFKKSMQSER